MNTEIHELRHSVKAKAQDGWGCSCDSRIWLGAPLPAEGRKFSVAVCIASGRVLGALIYDNRMNPLVVTARQLFEEVGT